MLLISIFAAGCLFVIGFDGVNTLICYAMVVLLGFGTSVFNLGPPLWASDFSSKENYAKTLKWLQIFYNLGGIIFPVIPGIIAEHTGEYRSSYLLFAALMIINLILLLSAYRKKRIQNAAQKQG